ncbi:unnamed protein product [Cylicostephanus goldi]|uniref:SSD domain-containing protein n=1 Tax=Cylicostephanus goldi TaxID=71465 RepID=A0A3P6RB81_CYLGO|nr:unnamed protein product [Cylicostephanus goldi]
MTFGIGIFTTLPGVRMFCLYTCLQVTFTYIYQLTFFSPVLAYAAEMENNGTHSLLFRKAMEPNETTSRWKLFFLGGSVSRKSLESTKVVPQTTIPVMECRCDVCYTDDILKVDARTMFGCVLITGYSKVGDSELKKKPSGWKSKLNMAVRKMETKLEHHEQNVNIVPHEETFVNKLFREIIGPFILERSTQICATLLYLVYIVLAIFGCLNMQEGLDPKFLVRESFYLSNFYKLIDESFWQEGLQMQVVVNRPPDLFNSTTRAEFSKMMNGWSASSTRSTTIYA